MYISFSRIVTIVVIASLYACLEGFLLLRSLKGVLGRGHGAAGNIGNKIPLWVYWPISLLAAGLYFYYSYTSGGLRSIFSLASSYWGLFFVVPFFILADILNLGLFITRVKSRAFSAWVRIATLVLAAGTIAMGSVSARYAQITNYSVTIEKPLPQKQLKLALISDLHIGDLIRKKQLERLVSQINALEADMVLIAGDIIDRNLTVFKNEKLDEVLKTLNATLGVYAAAGNHDYFGGNLEDLKKQLAAGGVKLLVDEAVLTNGVYVIGRNDVSSRRWGGAIRKPLRELTENLDSRLPLIVIDHQPSNLNEAEEAGIDLQVSGHTHRGQIWPGPIITKRVFEHDYGLFKKGKTSIVVTSGCGTWGPPVRIGSRSEIVLIELKN